MTTADPAAGLERLNALITPDLWKRVDGLNRAAVVGWGTMLSVAHLVRGIRTLHAVDKCHAALPSCAPSWSTRWARSGLPTRARTP